MKKKAVFSVSAKGTRVEGPEAELDRLARHFRRYDFVRLPGFFSPALVAQARKGMEDQNFYRCAHKDIATELCLRPNALFRLLHFISNDKRLFGLIQKMTACGPIGCFTGRIYRMNPGRHYDSWHDDWAHHRLIAMSVNLSEEVYRGGYLMLRPKNKPKAVLKIINTGPGDAILFRLGSGLEHQVAALEGAASKTAFAGWFRSRPDYFKSIKQLRNRKVAALL